MNTTEEEYVYRECMNYPGDEWWDYYPGPCNWGGYTVIKWEGFIGWWACPECGAEWEEYK